MDVERVFREEYGRAVAVLVRVFGDIDVAEEAVQDAFTVAVQRWPSDGVPPSPAGWIITTARNRAIDRLRREAKREDRHAQAALLQAGAHSEEEEDVVREFPFPPGFPEPSYKDTITVTKHPYYAAGIAVFATLTLGAAFEAARYARRSHAPVVKPDIRPAARVGSLELFSPDVVPTRRGLGVRWAGRIALPQPGN